MRMPWQRQEEQPPAPQPAPAPPPLTVVSMIPGADATDVGVETVITAVFDRPVQEDTVVFRVFGPNRTDVLGNTVVRANTVIFNPNAHLAFNTRYSVTLSSVRRTDGAPMGTPLNWSFTTAEAEEPEEPPAANRDHDRTDRRIAEAILGISWRAWVLLAIILIVLLLSPFFVPSIWSGTKRIAHSWISAWKETPSTVTPSTDGKTAGGTPTTRPTDSGERTGVEVLVRRGQELQHARIMYFEELKKRATDPKEVRKYLSDWKTDAATDKQGRRHGIALVPGYTLCECKEYITAVGGNFYAEREEELPPVRYHGGGIFIETVEKSNGEIETKWEEIASLGELPIPMFIRDNGNWKMNPGYEPKLQESRIMPSTFQVGMQKFYGGPYVGYTWYYDKPMVDIRGNEIPGSMTKEKIGTCRLWVGPYSKEQLVAEIEKSRR